MKSFIVASCCVTLMITLQSALTAAQAITAAPAPANTTAWKYCRLRDTGCSIRENITCCDGLRCEIAHDIWGFCKPAKPTTTAKPGKEYCRLVGEGCADNREFHNCCAGSFCLKVNDLWGFCRPLSERNVTCQATTQ